jgi:uncharacterized protein (TIGR00725 family)
MKVACFGASVLSEVAYAMMVSVGQLLARHGAEVLTGAFGGAMEAPAKGASMEGGKSTGYTLAGMSGNKYLSQLLDCQIIYGAGLEKEIQFGTRLGHLLLADAFIFAAEGGIGTIVELAAVCNFNGRGWKPQKKVAILDPQGSWKAMLDMMVKLGFLASSAMDCIQCFATAEEAVEWVCN